MQTLWHERKRYWAGVMAVTFSVVLSAVQNGLVFGLMRMVSFPIDMSKADVWVAGPKVQSCDLGSVFDHGRRGLVARCFDGEDFHAPWVK